MNENQVTFSGWRLSRLTTFRIGSAMVEILATSIWNRVMISTLGVPATIVGLLLGMRYFLAPFSVWVGHRSDTIPLFGYYRTSYIWVGRSLTVLSLPLLGFSLMRLEMDQGDVLGWVTAVFCFILYASGSVLTGTPYLALVRDSAPKEKQGFSISVTETGFIILIALMGIIFARWMEEYSLSIFWQMVLACMAIGGFFWIFSVYGVEKATISPEMRREQVQTNERNTDVMGTFRKIWADMRTRFFFFFLSLSTLAAWSQDTILEPFGAEVLNLETAATTRFTSYWQGATVIFLVGGAYMWRNSGPAQQSRLARWGLAIMAVGMSLIGVEAFLADGSIIMPALLVFGAGFGMYTFGALSLMAVMSTDEDAGAYLGLWTISILVFKGLGTFLGGALRDLFYLVLGLEATNAYAITFGLTAVGLAASTIFLARIDIVSFAREVGRVNPAEELISTASVEP